MPDKGDRRPSWGQAFSLGSELLGAIGGFALLGYWLDRHYGTWPWALLICIALGLIGGTYNLIRAAVRAERRDRGPESGGRGGPREGTGR